MEQLKKYKWLISAIVLVLAVVYYVQSTPIEAYRMIVDGSEVGYVSDKGFATAYLEKMMSDLSQNAYYEVELLTEVTYETGLVDEDNLLDEKSVQAILNKKANLQMNGYRISIDGNPFYTLKSKAEAQALLTKIKNQFSIDGAEVQDLAFLETVEIEKVVANASDISEFDTVWQAYEMGKEELQTYKVEKGDTTWDIAHRFGLSIEEIAAANLEADLTRLQIGQIIKLNMPQAWINVKTKTQTVEEQAILAVTYYEKVDTMYVGDYKLKEQGSDGLKKVELETTYINGIRENEQILSEEIVKEPTSTIMLTGTKWKEVAASGEFTNPTNGQVTSRFGTRWGRMHEGIDIGAPVGTAIRAADAGVVTSSKYISGYGYTVILDHGKGITTLYGHASELLVVVGQTVQKNELIARVGTSGSTTGACLHFEVRRNGVPIDPLPYLNY